MNDQGCEWTLIGATAASLVSLAFDVSALDLLAKVFSSLATICTAFAAMWLAARRDH